MKTNEKQFNLFVSEFKKFIDFWGLSSWGFSFNHTDTGSYFATVSPNYETRFCRVDFTNEVYTKFSDEEISKTAFHEACHILLADLYGCAINRYASRDELYREEEAIVLRLENKVFPLTRE